MVHKDQPGTPSLESDKAQGLGTRCAAWIGHSELQKLRSSCTSQSPRLSLHLSPPPAWGGGRGWGVGRVSLPLASRSTTFLASFLRGCSPAPLPPFQATWVPALLPPLSSGTPVSVAPVCPSLSHPLLTTDYPPSLPCRSLTLTYLLILQTRGGHSLPLLSEYRFDFSHLFFLTFSQSCSPCAHIYVPGS